MSKINKKRITKKRIIVFTDGSCSSNGKKGALGGIGIHFPNKELKDLSRVFRLGLATNQRTELYAILTAIRYIKQSFRLSDYKIIIKTDSQYSINSISKWAYGWMKKGWKTKSNTPVANREFIEILNKYYDKYDIDLVHVPAHTGGRDKNSLGNAKADLLATAATKKAQEELEPQCILESRPRGKARASTRSKGRINATKKAEYLLQTMGQNKNTLYQSKTSKRQPIYNRRYNNEAIIVELIGGKGKGGSRNKKIVTKKY